MRIIAGRFRSRTLAGPAGMATRPTSDRLRETLFNVLAPRIEGARFLDLYAGSGAVGIEALSRGAASVDFVERAPAALKVLRANLARLRIGAGFSIHGAGVGSVLRKMKPAMSNPGVAFDVVFLDPPYDALQEYAATLGLLGGAAKGLLAEGALVIAEHRRKEKPEARYGLLGRTRVLEQGDAALSFYAGADSGQGDDEIAHELALDGTRDDCPSRSASLERVSQKVAYTSANPSGVETPRSSGTFGTTEVVP